jgi:plasmid replication initiation protein
MPLAARRRPATRIVILDRSLESLPIFRLSDSADDSIISFSPESGGRWRVLPNPGDRVPGTFDQDVYVELLRRYHDAGSPADGTISFTLHAFLRSMGRRVDGRTYEQLRSALNRLQRTNLESSGVYFDASSGNAVNGSLSVLSTIAIDRRRVSDRDQLMLFPSLTESDPGDAYVTLSAFVRGNIAASHTAIISPQRYLALGSPVARRLYRLLEVARAEDRLTWRVTLEALAAQLPLAQRYPSHLQRVLQPAHEMLLSTGIVRDASIRQQRREWFVDYVLGSRADK